MPNVIVIAGPNGAGKSTAAPFLLRETFGIQNFVNADEIAANLTSGTSRNVAIEAGRVMHRRIRELSNRREDFAFETTLSTRSYARSLTELKRRGYNVHVVFLWLSSPELAIQRVATRVREGGHDIPVATIKRRYARGLDNFFKMYQPIADSWQMFDASGDDPIEVAFGSKLSDKVVVDDIRWKQIEK